MSLFGAWMVSKLGERMAAVFWFVFPIAILLGGFVGLYLLGHRNGWNERDQQAQHQALADRNAALQQLLQLNELGARIAGDYVLRRGAIAVEYRTIRKEIPHVVTKYIAVPGAAPEPLPQCIFTRGFVGLWNRALMPDAAAGTADAPAGAGAAGDEQLLDSGVSQQALLENHVDNGEVNAAVRSQCEALLAWHKKVTP